MKVAFFTHSLAFQSGAGGAEIQMLKTKEYLERLGVEIELFDIWKHKITDYDLVHIFNPARGECLDFLRYAKGHGVPTVVSPVFWVDSSFIFHMNDSNAQKAIKWLYYYGIRQTLPSTRGVLAGKRGRLFMEADLLLPNSHLEQRNIQKYFTIEDSKFKVVYNGVDLEFEFADPSLFIGEYGVSDYVLCVGFFDPRKNQLAVIKALEHSTTPLVFIGGPRAGFEAYYDECRQMAEGRGNVLFVPPLQHSDPMLKSAFAAARLLVMPSLHETPGLVALEAALAGTSLVVTKHGSTAEYFRDYAYYVDPLVLSDIQEKIELCLDRDRNRELKKYVKENFSWACVANQTLEAYRHALKV